MNVVCTDENPSERVPYLSALEECSRQGAIEIHVYLNISSQRVSCTTLPDDGFLRSWKVRVSHCNYNNSYTYQITEQLSTRISNTEGQAMVSDYFLGLQNLVLQCSGVHFNHQ